VADVFREVDEELRRDRAEQLWKKYGTYLLAVAIGIVLAVAGMQGWRAYQQSQREALSNQYAAAQALVRGGDTAAGLNAFAAMGEIDAGGYPGLAALREAALRADSGDVAGAVAIWDGLARDSGLGEGFRQVATLLSVMHQANDGDPAALQARLAPLTGAGQAFRATALELSAVLALRAGDRETARGHYQALADDRSVPTGLRGRASQMLNALED
jgi:hypothetical protein